MLLLEAQRRSEKLVRDFVEEQLAAGYSVSDLNTLYSVECALIPTLEELDGGQVRVRLVTRIIEREDAEEREPEKVGAA